MIANRCAARTRSANWASVVFSALLAALALAPVRARAQAGRVDGVVFDSLRKRPLAGAIVQLIEAPPGHAAYAATTDSLGRFRLSDVHAGQYISGILDPLLDTLGVLAPYRSVTVAEGRDARVSLAIPSAARLTSAICATGQPARATKATDSTGTLVGHVYDVQRGSPAASSLIAVVWPVLTLDVHGVHRESRQLHARANDEGWFAICGLDPGDYQVRAESGARNTGFIDAVVLPRDIARLSLVLGADSASLPSDTAAHGSARLAGTVTTHDGRPLEGAQVAVDGSPVTAATDVRGGFALTGVPDGSRMVEARALGYAPTRVAVSPSRDETQSVAIVMEKRVETLQTVTVFGKENRRVRDLTGFAERSKRGFGRFLTRDQLGRTDVQSVCDLLRRVPGVNVSTDAGMGCGASIRGMGSPTGCEPTIYLDNTPFGGSVAEFTRSVPPGDIMGIEIYSTATEPAQFPGGCGSIVVWTR
jgi:hypothetical protein